MKVHPNSAEIKIVSSASQPEEEASTLSSISDSNSISAELKVRPATTITSTTSTTSKPSSSSGGAVVPVDFDEPKVAPSPVPVPIQGGDDEIIRVSHVRKIIINTSSSKESLPKVKTAAAGARVFVPPSSSREERKQTTKRNADPTNHHPNNSSSSLQQKKKKKMSHRRHIDTSDDEDSESSDSEPMDVIGKSPYEAGMDAEKGVELFTRMKNVLKEKKGSEDYRTVNEEATKIFGPANAWCLVKANGLIEKSGMVYSQEWVTGNIRGNQIGKIPKDLLLVCLVSSRFAKAQDLLLSGLTRDFEVTGTVQEAINAWKFAGYHKILAVSNKNMQFQTRRRDCYKCAIFVGRAYACYKAFGMKETLESSLVDKIKACLDLMELHLPEPNAASKKKRKSGELAPPAAVVRVPNKVVSESAADAPKRKRGRPRKNPLPESVKAPGNGEDNASKDSLMEDDDDMVPYNPPKKKGRKSSSASKKATVDLSDDGLDDDDDMVPYNPPVRGTNGKARKCSSTNGPKTKSAPVATAGAHSLSNLVSKFEAQYETMGEVYKQMGLTLQELKSKIQENRTATEEEIRNELLLEVQDNLLKSFGKK